MKPLFRRLFGPRNAFILFFDHVREADQDGFESQVREVKKYYDFAKVGTLVQNLRQGKAKGQVAVAFKNARKSVFLRAVPFLREFGIPFTVFARVDEIGTSGLPLEDEVESFRIFYPDEVSSDEAAKVLAEAWSNPDATRAKLNRWRREVGPLAFPRMDGTQFFAVWGKLVDVPRGQIEVGLNITADNLTREKLAEQIKFIQFQMGEVPTTAFASGPVDESLLRSVGITGCLGPKIGLINRTSNPMSLPHWQLELLDEEKNGLSEKEIVGKNAEASREEKS